MFCLEELLSGKLSAVPRKHNKPIAGDNKFLCDHCLKIWKEKQQPEPITEPTIPSEDAQKPRTPPAVPSSISKGKRDKYGNVKGGKNTHAPTQARQPAKPDLRPHQPASKQFLINAPPSVLMLHLKRFEHTAVGFKKVSTHVTFPLILDLAPFCAYM